MTERNAYKPRQLTEDPLGKAIMDLAHKRGFGTDRAVAQAMGMSHVNFSRVKFGKAVLSPQSMSHICDVLQPADGQEIDSLLDPWEAKLEEKRKKRFGQPRPLLRNSPSTKAGIEIENVANALKISLVEFNRRLGIGLFLGIRIRTQFLSVSSYSELLERVEKSEFLSPEQKDAISEGVAQTIADAFREGHNLKSFGTSEMKKIQMQSDQPLYNGEQVARMLGTTRQGVSLLRRSEGIENVLMSPEQVEQLRRRKQLNVQRQPHQAYRILAPKKKPKDL